MGERQCAALGSVVKLKSDERIARIALVCPLVGDLLASFNFGNFPKMRKPSAFVGCGIPGFDPHPRFEGFNLLKKSFDHFVPLGNGLP